MTSDQSHFAVIFTARLKASAPGYDATAKRMVELAADMPGFLGITSARGEDRVGVTVSYWQSEEAIGRWRAHPEHADARRRGREQWYEWWDLKVARIERAYHSEVNRAG